MRSPMKCDIPESINGKKGKIGMSNISLPLKVLMLSCAIVTTLSASDFLDIHLPIPKYNQPNSETIKLNPYYIPQDSRSQWGTLFAQWVKNSGATYTIQAVQDDQNPGRLVFYCGAERQDKNRSLIATHVIEAKSGTLRIVRSEFNRELTTFGQPAHPLHPHSYAHVQAGSYPEGAPVNYPMHPCYPNYLHPPFVTPYSPQRYAPCPAPGQLASYPPHLSVPPVRYPYPPHRLAMPGHPVPYTPASAVSVAPVFPLALESSDPREQKARELRTLIANPALDPTALSQVITELTALLADMKTHPFVAPAVSATPPATLPVAAIATLPAHTPPSPSVAPTAQSFMNAVAGTQSSVAVVPKKDGPAPAAPGQQEQTTDKQSGLVIQEATSAGTQIAVVSASGQASDSQAVATLPESAVTQPPSQDSPAQTEVVVSAVQRASETDRACQVETAKPKNVTPAVKLPVRTESSTAGGAKAPKAIQQKPGAPTTARPPLPATIPGKDSQKQSKNAPNPTKHIPKQEPAVAAPAPTVQPPAAAKLQAAPLQPAPAATQTVVATKDHPEAEHTKSAQKRARQKAKIYDPSLWEIPAQAQPVKPPVETNRPDAPAQPPVEQPSPETQAPSSLARQKKEKGGSSTDRQVHAMRQRMAAAEKRRAAEQAAAAQKVEQRERERLAEEAKLQAQEQARQEALPQVAVLKVLNEFLRNNNIRGAQAYACTFEPNDHRFKRIALTLVEALNKVPDAQLEWLPPLSEKINLLLEACKQNPAMLTVKERIFLHDYVADHTLADDKGRSHLQAAADLGDSDAKLLLFAYDCAAAPHECEQECIHKQAVRYLTDYTGPHTFFYFKLGAVLLTIRNCKNGGGTTVERTQKAHELLREAKHHVSPTQFVALQQQLGLMKTVGSSAHAPETPPTAAASAAAPSVWTEKEFAETFGTLRGQVEQLVEAEEADALRIYTDIESHVEALFTRRLTDEQILSLFRDSFLAPIFFLFFERLHDEEYSTCKKAAREEIARLIIKHATPLIEQFGAHASADVFRYMIDTSQTVLAGTPRTPTQVRLDISNLKLVPSQSPTSPIRVVDASEALAGITHFEGRAGVSFSGPELQLCMHHNGRLNVDALTQGLHIKTTIQNRFGKPFADQYGMFKAELAELADKAAADPGPIIRRFFKTLDVDKLGCILSDSSLGKWRLVLYTELVAMRAQDPLPWLTQSAFGCICREVEPLFLEELKSCEREEALDQGHVEKVRAALTCAQIGAARVATSEGAEVSEAFLALFQQFEVEFVAHVAKPGEQLSSLVRPFFTGRTAQELLYLFNHPSLFSHHAHLFALLIKLRQEGHLHQLDHITLMHICNKVVAVLTDQITEYQDKPDRQKVVGMVKRTKQLAIDTIAQIALEYREEVAQAETVGLEVILHADSRSCQEVLSWFQPERSDSGSAPQALGAFAKRVVQKSKTKEKVCEFLSALDLYCDHAEYPAVRKALENQVNKNDAQKALWNAPTVPRFPALSLPTDTPFAQRFTTFHKELLAHFSKHPAHCRMIDEVVALIVELLKMISSEQDLEILLTVTDASAVLYTRAVIVCAAQPEGPIGASAAFLHLTRVEALLEQVFREISSNRFYTCFIPSVLVIREYCSEASSTRESFKKPSEDASDEATLLALLKNHEGTEAKAAACNIVSRLKNSPDEAAVLEIMQEFKDPRFDKLRTIEAYAWVKALDLPFMGKMDPCQNFRNHLHLRLPLLLEALKAEKTEGFKTYLSAACAILELIVVHDSPGVTTDPQRNGFIRQLQAIAAYYANDQDEELRSAAVDTIVELAQKLTFAETPFFGEALQMHASPALLKALKGPLLSPKSGINPLVQEVLTKLYVSNESTV